MPIGKRWNRLKKNTQRWLNASAETSLLTFSADVELQAAESDDAPVPVRILAYSGGIMNVPGHGNVVIDLSDLELAASVTLLSDHENKRDAVLGPANAEIRDGAVLVAGTLSRKSSAAREIIDLHADGVKWQASIGLDLASATKAKIREGQSVTVNGRTLTAGRGGFTLIRGSKLRETTITALGCDHSTVVSIAASFQGDIEMKFEQWLKARGFVDADLSDEQRTSLKAMYDAEQSTDENTELTASTGTSTSNVVIETEGDGVATLRASYAAETQRVADINRICASHECDQVEIDGQKVTLSAHAIANGWSADRTELHAMRAVRPSAPAGHVSDNAVTDQVLASAVLMSGGYGEDETVEACGEKAVIQARKSFRRGIGLQELLLMAASMAGQSFRTFRGNEKAVLQAAFSTTSLPGILSNAANKFLLQGFNAVESTWREIASIKPVNDFKTITSYRLTGDMMYEKVGASGELKHGSVGEESYTNKADTYGKIFSLTRQDMRNDDLGALAAIRTKLGRGAALKINDVFWTVFLANSDFFKADNNNYFDGAATNLQSSSLTTAVTKLRKQVDADGKPLALRPAILLVTPEDEVTAEELYVSTNLNTGGSSTKDKVPNRNVHASKYRPVVSTYLSNSAYDGYSTTGWYLLVDPMDLSVIEVVFLDGQETPIVEEAEADFDTLGIQFRGYHDFGVSKQDYRGGVKSKGAA